MLIVWQIWKYFPPPNSSSLQKLEFCYILSLEPWGIFCNWHSSFYQVSRSKIKNFKTWGCASWALYKPNVTETSRTCSSIAPSTRSQAIVLLLSVNWQHSQELMCTSTCLQRALSYYYKPEDLPRPEGSRWHSQFQMMAARSNTEPWGRSVCVGCRCCAKHRKGCNQYLTRHLHPHPHQELLKSQWRAIDCECLRGNSGGSHFPPHTFLFSKSSTSIF